MKGVFGYARQGSTNPPPTIEPYCKFSAPIPCHCGPDVVTNFDTAYGCSNKSYELAEQAAPAACTALCDQARRNSGTHGGVGGRPGGSTGGGVTFDGSGILDAREEGDYVGYVPFSLEAIGPTWEKERLAEELVQRTSVPWVWLHDLGESIQWEDSRGSAAFVQAYWSNRGVPRPIGICRHSVQRACPLEDVMLGDSLQVCSAESETDAQQIAQTSCAPLRYNALSRSWGAWAIYGTQEASQYSAPSATVVAVGPRQFLGYIPSSLRVVGIYEDWVKLADELLERTAGTTVWLAGPAKFYAPGAE